MAQEMAALSKILLLWRYANMRAYKYSEKGLERIDIRQDFVLEDLQKQVGGYIEVVKGALVDDGFGRILMIVDEEGKLKGYEETMYAPSLADMLCGPIIFLQENEVDGEEFKGIDTIPAIEEIQRLVENFGRY